MSAVPSQRKLILEFEGSEPELLNASRVSKNNCGD
jgi:hypothetical protein